MKNASVQERFSAVAWLYHNFVSLNLCAEGYVYGTVVINILNHFNYKKGKIALVGQKQLREL